MAWRWTDVGDVGETSRLFTISNVSNVKETAGVGGKSLLLNTLTLLTFPTPKK